jgi:energy-coupling factor transporter ATP-binding protein EcfA2
VAVKKKTKTVSPKNTTKPPLTAFRHFGLTVDPFTTLALQKHNLDYFIGREALIDRLSSALFSLGNVGVAGEPGMGKSSILQVLQNRVPSSYHRISIGVPLDDAHYLLSELLREILVEVPKVPGLNLKEISRRVEEEALSKNTLLSLIKSIAARSKKPFLVFVDDLEKIKGDRVQHLTRSERTLQLLEELKPLLELANFGFVISLQEEFYAKVGLVVKEGAEPTVLGLFKNIVLVERFTVQELRQLLNLRLGRAGFKGGAESFLEPEALTLSLALADGNPRRFLYLLSEGMYRGFVRRGERVEFQDLFEAVNEHLKLDLVCKKLLYFLAKSGRAVASNSDLQAFMGLDMISISRRLEVLTKNRLAEMVDVADGMKVFALPGSRAQAAAPVMPSSPTRILKTADGEKRYELPSGPGI